MKYFILNKDITPQEIEVEKSEDQLSTFDTYPFTAKRLSDDLFEFNFNYETGSKTKKFKLNWCVLSDLSDFLKILEDVEPGWKDSSKKLIRGEELK